MPDLTANKKLVWAGLSRSKVDISEVKDAIEEIKEKIGDIDEFLDDVDGFSSFDELEQYLIDKGFKTDKAQRFVDQIRNNFSSYNEFLTALDEADSFAELLNNFNSNNIIGAEQTTPDGIPVCGIRFLADGGVTFAGVDVGSASTVEVFGERVEISEVTGESAEDAGGEITYSNLNLADTSVTPGEITTISADVENTYQVQRDVQVSLTTDGQVTNQQSITLGPGEVKTVSFSWSRQDIGEYFVAIGTTSEQNIFVEPDALRTI